MFTEKAPNPELLGVLAQMVNLENLKLVVQEGVDVGDENTLITLPRLKVLIIVEIVLLGVLTLRYNTPASIIGYQCLSLLSSGLLLITDHVVSKF